MILVPKKIELQRITINKNFNYLYENIDNIYVIFS